MTIKKLISSVIITQLLFSCTVTSGHADATTTPPKVTCKSVILACNKAIKDKNGALELQDITIKKLVGQNIDLNRQVGELQESSNAWYKNPFVIAILGIATGVVVGKTVLFK